MKIEDRGYMVIVWGNMLDWYDEATDSLYDTAPIRFENGRIEEICEKYVAISKEEGFVLYIVNGIGDVEDILSTDGELMSTKEAADRWGISEAYIRRRITEFPTGTARKFGKQWVVTKSGMEAVFGEKKAEIIHTICDFPVDGEMYVVGRYDGKYFFAWGHSAPYEAVNNNKIPSSNVRDGENGINFFNSLEEAEKEMLESIRAFEHEEWFEEHEDVQEFFERSGNRKENEK